MNMNERAMDKIRRLNRAGRTLVSMNVSKFGIYTKSKEGPHPVDLPVVCRYGHKMMESIHGSWTCNICREWKMKVQEQFESLKNAELEQLKEKCDWLYTRILESSTKKDFPVDIFPIIPETKPSLALMVMMYLPS